MTNDEMEQMQMQKLSNTAVEIANQVNKYVHRECMRKVNHGVADPFMLEDMVYAYARAMASCSLYKVLPENKRPSWGQLLETAIDNLTTAFEHVQAHMDKIQEHKPCIYTGVQ